MAQLPLVVSQVTVMPKKPLPPSGKYTVTMRVRVGREGRVVMVSVEDQPVDREYAAAAAYALFGFVFQPGRDAAGRPLSCDITYRYRWQE